MHTYTPNEVPLSSYARFGSSWLFYKFASFFFIFRANTFKIKPDEQIAQIGKSTRRSVIIGLIQSILDQPSLVRGWWKINWISVNGQLVVKFLCDYEIWEDVRKLGNMFTWLKSVMSAENREMTSFVKDKPFIDVSLCWHCKYISLLCHVRKE